MKYALMATMVAGLMMAGCESENPGLHLGKFKNECLEQKGTLTPVEPTSNNWKCTLPDGTETFSK
jgi:hypothetical protein